MGRRRRHRPGPRHRPARRRAHRRRHRRRRHRDPADRPARGRGLHRLGRPPSRRSTGCADDRAVDAARGDQRQGGARPAADRRRRRGRLRDGHGVAGPRLAGHADRAGRPAAAAAGAGRRRGGGRVAARAPGSTCGWAPASPPPAGRAREVVLDHRRTASCAATRCWSPSAAGARTPGHRRGHRRPGARASTSTSTTPCRCAGVPWLYGVGDVNGRRQLTHMGKYQARQAGAAIVARARGEEVVDRRLVAVRRDRRRRRDAVGRVHRSRRSPASG